MIPKLVSIENGLQQNGQNKQTEKQGPADYEEAITTCGYGKFHYLLLITLIPSTCAQIFSTGTLSYVLSSAECDLELTNVHKGALNAGPYAGMILSAFVWGFVLDVFGRRKLIVVGFLLDFTFNFLATFAHKFWLLLLLKICTGLSITGSNAAIYAYIAETHSSVLRPRIMMITGSLFALAQTIQPIMAYFLIPMNFRYTLIPGVLDFTPWRLFILVCSLPSLMSALLFLFYPESPKFLMSQGHTSKALESFKRIHAVNTGNTATEYPIKHLQAPPKMEVRTVVDGQGSEKPSIGICTILKKGWTQISPIFRPPYLNVALLVVSIQFGIMISFSSLRLWTPQLFTTLSIAANSQSPQVAQATSVCHLLTFVQSPSTEQLATESRACLPVKGEVFLRSLLIGLAATASFLLSTPLIGILGKRNIARICLPLGAVLAIAMNWATSSNMFMVLIGAYVGAVENELVILSAMTVDSFPTAFRSMAISLQLTSGRIGSITGNLLFPVLLSINCNAIFFSFGGLLLLVSVLVWAIPKREEKH